MGISFARLRQITGYEQTRYKLLLGNNMEATDKHLITGVNNNGKKKQSF